MKILVVDDHPLVREGLRQLLLGLENCREVIEAATADEALKGLEGHPGFDLVLLDLNLPGRDGLALLQDFGRKAPDVPVVMLSGVEDPLTMRRALAAGAAGFIPKSSLSQVILPALRLVLAGGIYVPVEMLSGGTSVSVLPSPRMPVLTARQDEVLRLLVAGKSNKEIAAVMDLSEPTVKGHVVAVFRALQVRTRGQAVAAASHLGFQ